MPSTLCQNCLEAFREWERLGLEPVADADYFLLHPHLTTISLIRSARSCHMCFLLLEPKYNIKEDDNADPYVNQIRIHALSSGVYSLTLRESGASRTGFSVFSRVLHGQEISQEEAAQPLNTASDYTNCDFNKLLAKKWFDNCQGGHEACRVVVEDYQLPTRLIDIGTQRRMSCLVPSMQLSKPRLVLSAQLPSDTPYATLSHCWGELKITTLRKKNLRKFQRHISRRKLCKTFLDSFDTARRFGLRYIWIDSLCIIQDDDADWATESLLMGQVYGFSKLNIAAAGAKDGTKGLFFSRDPLVVEKFRTTLRLPSTGELPITIEWSLGMVHMDCVQLSPLGRRAWAFQERFLAPRTLHFGETQLFWQCKTLQACEAYSEKLPPLNFQVRTETNVDVSVIDESMPLEETWAYILESFTKARLTKPDDKLVAISGVAKLLAKKYGGSYVCGLWEENLLNQLLWFSKYPNKRPDIYRAPSWSWASLDGHISQGYFGRLESKPDLPYVISIIDIHVVPLGPSIYGKIKKASIRLNCLPLLPYNFEMSSLIWHPNGIFSSMDEEHGRTDGNVRLLRDNCYYLRFRGGQKHCYIVGLIVQASREVQGQYRRVGHFTLEPKGDQWLQRAQQAPERMIESSLYERGPWATANGEIRCIISLV